MQLLLITLFEIIYLFYMYFIFKTSYSFNLAIFNDQVNNLGSFFIHDTNIYQNKICIFGKYMAILAIILAAIRLYYNNSKTLFKYNLIFDLLCLVLATVMNLNALVYIIPIIFSEIYIMFFI
jgi:hypothetical protein